MNIWLIILIIAFISVIISLVSLKNLENNTHIEHAKEKLSKGRIVFQESSEDEKRLSSSASDS